MQSPMKLNSDIVTGWLEEQSVSQCVEDLVTMINSGINNADIRHQLTKTDTILSVDLDYQTLSP